MTSTRLTMLGCRRLRPGGEGWGEGWGDGGEGGGEIMRGEEGE